MAARDAMRLRFKRAGWELAGDAKAHVTLETGVREELRHVFQNYGQWEMEEIGRKGIATGSSTIKSVIGREAGDDGHSTAGGSQAKATGMQEALGEETSDSALHGSLELSGVPSKHWERLNFMAVGQVHGLVLEAWMAALSRLKLSSSMGKL